MRYLILLPFNETIPQISQKLRREYLAIYNLQAR